MFDFDDVFDNTQNIENNNACANTNSSDSTPSIKLHEIEQNENNQHGVPTGNFDNEMNGIPFKTPGGSYVEGIYAELQKTFDRVVISPLTFEYYLSYVIKLSKKKIDTNEIRKQYSINIKEIIQITETLRGVTFSGTKARLTRTLYKTKNIFKYQCPKSSIINVSNSNEIEDCSMEPVQFSGTI